MAGTSNHFWVVPLFSSGCCRETELESYGHELARFRGAEDSQRLTSLIERGREEIAELMVEWEEATKVIEEAS